MTYLHEYLTDPNYTAFSELTVFSLFCFIEMVTNSSWDSQRLKVKFTGEVKQNLIYF